MKTQWIIVCGLAFALLTAFAAVMNTGTVTLNYYWGEIDVSLIVLISASIAIGGAIVALFGTLRPILSSRTGKIRLQDKYEQFVQENQNLYAKLSELEVACASLMQQNSQDLDRHRNAEIGNQSRTGEEQHQTIRSNVDKGPA